MSNDIQLKISYSLIPLKYVGDTGVKSLPCTVSDMIDQGVMICDGRFSDAACWEGEGLIISPTIPAGTKKIYQFTHPDLQPANQNYSGALVVDFSSRAREKIGRMLVVKISKIN